MEDSILIRYLTIEDLQKLIRSTIREEIQLAIDKKPDENKYLTRKEAAALLKISLPTLNQYTKIGIINGFRIGTRVLYNLKDLESSMNEIITSRYARSKLR
jgi:excisionase family DNA binding protein